MTARVLIPLLVSIGFAGAAAAQGFNVDPAVGTGGAASPVAVRQCNGSVDNPVPVIAGCTAIINSRQSTAIQRSAAYTNRARAFLRRDQADRALADFDLAVMLDPEEFARVGQSRRFLFRDGGVRPRRRRLRPARSQPIPRTSKPIVSAAMSRLMTGEPERAIPDYDKAIAVNPKFANAYANRGEAYRVQDEFDRAIAEFNQAIMLNPKFAIAYDNRGISLCAKGRLRAGDRRFRRGAQDRSDDDDRLHASRDGAHAERCTQSCARRLRTGDQDRSERSRISTSAGAICSSKGTSSNPP